MDECLLYEGPAANYGGQVAKTLLAIATAINPCEFRHYFCCCLLSVSATAPIVIFDSRSQLSKTTWSSIDSGRVCGLRSVGDP